MTDVFAARGINFQSSSMASTHPTAAPPPIPAGPAIQQDNAATIFGDNEGHDLPDAPMGNPAPQDSAANAQPSAPQQISTPLAGLGNDNEDAGAAGAAPPQPPTNSGGRDLFELEGIKPPDPNDIPAPNVQQINANAFQQGVVIPPRNQDAPPAPVAEIGGYDKDGKPIVNPVAYAQNQQSQDQQLSNLLFTPQELASFKNNPIGFAEAASKVNAYGYVLGDNDADAIKLAPIGYKVLNKQPLSQNEQNELIQWARNKEEINLRGFSWGGNTAYIGLQMPSWAAQLILSGGVGKAAEVGAERVGIIAAENALSGAAIRVLTQGSTLMAAHYTAQHAEQQLNDISALTDKGALLLHDSENSPAKTAALAFGHTAADVIPQMMTPAISKYVVNPIKNVLATPITVAAKNLSPEVTNALYSAWKAIQPSATVSKMFTAAGWNGMVEQLGANRVQQVMNASLDYAGNKHETFDQLMDALIPSKDQLLVEAGLVSGAGFIHASTALTVHLLQSKGVSESTAWETANNMSSLEKDAFVNQHLDLPQSETPTLNPSRSDYYKYAKSGAEQIIADARTDRAATAQDVQGGKDYMNSLLKKDNQPSASPDTPFFKAAGGASANLQYENNNSAREIIDGGTREANAANPALIRDQNSGFNASFKTSKIYAEMWNDLQPIENLKPLAESRGAVIPQSKLSPASLSLAKSTPALIERQWTTGTTTWDAEGNQVVTGKGLKQISDDFDNMMLKDEPNRDIRQKDMSDFRKAMTFIEDKTHGYNPVSEKDYSESQATLSRLTEKYGDKMKWFETFAKEYRDWDNRILHNLVTSGLKTQAWYDDLVGKREWYSSTARVTEAEYPKDVAQARAAGIGADVNPKNIGALKQRKGSDLEVEDPVKSSMRNSAIIIKRAMLNKVRADVAKYAEYYPEKVKVKNPAIIREQVEHSYDPKLRTKLEQVSKALGGTVKRLEQGEKVAGSKKILGAYEPATKTTYLRPGTTEGTLTHEIGHMLDHIYGLKEKFLASNKMKAELEKLAEDRLRSRIFLERTPEGKTEFAEEFERNPKKYVNYVKNPDEVIANFFDSWVNSPEQTERTAPLAKAMFEKFIDNHPDLAMLKQIEPSTQRDTEVIQKQLLDFKGPKNSIPFYDNGKLKFLHMDEDTARAFNGLDQVQSTLTGGFIAKIGKAQARMLQFGATNNPYFIVRHFLRGAQSSYVNTPEGGPVGFFRHFAVEIPKGIAAVIGKNDVYREWAASSGALRTYLDTSSKGIAKLHAEMFDKADMSKFLNPVNWATLAKNGLVNGWQTAKQVSDYAPRIAAYERLKAKGYSDLEAGFLSLEATGNYIRHGSLGKEINAYSPFFNDRLQGADRFLRAIKRDPAGYSLRALALITMPQLLVTGYYLFAADEKTRNAYLNLSDFRRSAAMNMQFTKDGPFIPLPRAFAPGFVFGAIPEFAMIHFFAKDAPALKNFWLRMIGDTANSLSPSTDWTQTIPPIMKSAIESQTNFSFYRQQALFHGDINKTAPENQFNSSTSESAKALGKLFGISPAKIDNTAYDMGAHVAVYAEQLGDYAINTQKRLSGQPVNERPTSGADNPLYGPLMQPEPVGTHSESFQEFNEHAHDLAQQENRYKELTGNDKSNFKDNNLEDLRVYPTIAAANTRVMHEEHEIRLITENPQFSGDQKAQMIAQHQLNIETIVEGANKYYRNAKGQK